MVSPGTTVAPPTTDVPATTPVTSPVQTPAPTPPVQTPAPTLQAPVTTVPITAPPAEAKAKKPLRRAIAEIDNDQIPVSPIQAQESSLPQKPPPWEKALQRKEQESLPDRTEDRGTKHDDNKQITDEDRQEDLKLIQELVGSRNSTTEEDRSGHREPPPEKPQNRANPVRERWGSSDVIPVAKPAPAGPKIGPWGPSIVAAGDSQPAERPTEQPSPAIASHSMKDTW